MLAVLSDMKVRLRLDPLQKFVMFSQHHECLEMVQSTFELVSSEQFPIDTFHHKLSSVRADSHTSKQQREENLQTFYHDSSCNVLLLTSGTAASGLTLTMASVCYILEPSANAGEEAQALSRIHRIGQQKQADCVIFYARGTCEERLLALRERSRNLTEMLSSSDALAVQTQSESFDASKKKAGAKKQQRQQQRQNRFRNAVAGDDDDSDAPSDDDNEFGRRRRTGGVARASTAAADDSTGGFFNVGNLTHMYGSTAERTALRTAAPTVSSSSSSSSSSNSHYLPNVNSLAILRKFLS